MSGLPTPIEPIHWEEPRAVEVREHDGSNTTSLKGKHSAVSGRIFVYTETVEEAEAVINAWRVIMQSAADRANEILTAIRTEAAIKAAQPATAEE